MRDESWHINTEDQFVMISHERRYAQFMEDNKFLSVPVGLVRRAHFLSNDMI